VMVGALLLAMTSWKRMGQPGQPDLHVAGGPPREAGPGRGTGSSRKARPQSSGDSGGLMGRLEERWKRRWEERGGDSR